MQYNAKTHACDFFSAFNLFQKNTMGDANPYCQLEELVTNKNHCIVGGLHKSNFETRYHRECFVEIN